MKFVFIITLLSIPFMSTAMNVQDGDSSSPADRATAIATTCKLQHDKTIMPLLIDYLSHRQKQQTTTPSRIEQGGSPELLPHASTAQLLQVVVHASEWKIERDYRTTLHLNAFQATWWLLIGMATIGSLLLRFHSYI